MAFISEIKAGDFNCRIKLKSNNTSQNTFGEKATSSYSTEATVWANKNVTSLRNINEKFEGEKLQSYSKFFFMIRYSSSLKNNLQPDWIIEDNSTSEVYDILSYIIDPRREYIEFYAELKITDSIA
jgi:head-tail adaptor